MPETEGPRQEWTTWPCEPQQQSLPRGSCTDKGQFRFTGAQGARPNRPNTGPIQSKVQVQRGRLGRRGERQTWRSRQSKEERAACVPPSTGASPQGPLFSKFRVQEKSLTGPPWGLCPPWLGVDRSPPLTTLSKSYPAGGSPRGNQRADGNGQSTPGHVPCGQGVLPPCFT